MMKKRDWIFVSCIVVLAIALFIYFDRVQILELIREQNREDLPVTTRYQDVQNVNVKTNPIATPQGQSLPARKGDVPLTTEKKAEETTIRVAEINLAVPFTSQAPTGNWQEPYKNSCEEASVLMVREYYAGNQSTVLDPTSVEQSLQDIVALENTLFGYYLDTTVAETANFAKELYGFASTELIENPTVDQIKEQLNQGNPVLVPAAGQLLKNPYYTQPGPIYHMLVIRGYTKNNQFIVNDPGTKHGNAYVYSFDTIMNAMHDWNADDILNGKKVVLILHPKK